MTTFVLTYNNKPVAVINTKNPLEMGDKLIKAIKDEVVADKDTQFEYKFRYVSDDGKHGRILTSYVTDGLLIQNDDGFNLTEVTTY